MAQCSEVEFKTLDGLTLRGTLYLSSEPHGPAIVMTPGVSYTLHIPHADFVWTRPTADNLTVQHDERNVPS